MISKALPREVKEDFDIVVQLAESIGLVQRQIVRRREGNFIENTPNKRHRKRKCNYSDLLHFEREAKAKNVRERSRSQPLSAGAVPVEDRKGSIKDVFFNRLKPQEDPVLRVKTQKLIMRNDLARAQKYARDSKRVTDMLGNKQQRSKILVNIAEGVVPQQRSARKQPSSPLRFYGEKRSGAKTARTISYEKLAISLDFSKFHLVPRIGGVQLVGRDLNRERRTQTARDGRRWVHMCFNSSNKAELIYPRDESESELF